MANVMKANPKNVGFFWPSFFDCRQVFGQEIHFKNRNELSLNLYKSISTRKEFIWDNFYSMSKPKHKTHSGGIFNVEYSPDGCLLLAATENKNILIFSSNTHSLENEITNGHKSCVNLVKFLDSRIFVTCSDDNTIAVWDLRNTSNKIKSLNGHKNWVKSVEYDSSKGILLSSAYDQCVLKWDINSSSNNYECVLQIENMLRMVLTPDSSKMIISTSDGYLIIIHDLDLNTLSEDLKGIKQLLKFKHKYGIDLSSKFKSILTATKNRPEFVCDFPQNDRNGYITTLDVHPFGWSVLSRNTSGNQLNEWSCVHDIQHINHINNDFKSKSIFDNHSSDSASSESNSSINSIDSNESLTSNQIRSSESIEPNIEYRQINRWKVCEYKPRLKYYIEELNENHGFIKEQCFSPDGRIICSPFQFGYRLLSFNSNCDEMSDCIEDKPKELFELKRNFSHSDYVLTTKFSPTVCQIASGCLKGRVVFSQPIF